MTLLECQKLLEKCTAPMCFCAPSAYLIKYMNTFSKALIHLRFMGNLAWSQAVIKQCTACTGQPRLSRG